MRNGDCLFICKHCGEYICCGDQYLALEDGRLCMDCAYEIDREELLAMAGIEFIEAGEEEL